MNDNPLIVNRPQLTYAAARLALDAAVAEAERIGGAFNVAVADAGGVLLAFARMDGAFAESGAIARDKAWTVASFAGLPSRALYEAIEAEPAVRDGIGGRDRVAAFGGGVPIRIDGALAGAVGASGGSAAQDEQVAQAGADAVIAAYESVANEGRS